MLIRPQIIALLAVLALAVRCEAQSLETVNGAGSGAAGLAANESTPVLATVAENEDEDPDLSINHAVLDYTIVNLPTTLRLPRFKSAFRVTHRFTRPLNGGSFGDLAGDLFGLDSAAQIGLEYRFAFVSGGEIVFYRTSDKTIALLGQYNVVRQNARSPVALSAVVSVEGTNNFKDHYSPAFGAVVSRELADRAAVFLQPIWVNNTNRLSPEPADEDATFLVGIGARARMRPTMHLVFEIAARAAGFKPGVTPVSFGVEKQVGGHVFQLNFSNTLGSTLAQVARGGPTPRSWFLGFNITRKFY